MRAVPRGAAAYRGRRARGVGRGEVMMILGRSHTGKSQILLNSIVWNLVNHHDAHAVIFSLDEPRELVLMKLFCLLKGRSSEQVEEAIKQGDKDTLSDLERAATQELSRVAIVDEALQLDEMERVMARTGRACAPVGAGYVPSGACGWPVRGPVWRRA